MYERKISILGYGEIKQGVSANGRPYAFRPVYVSYESPFAVGVIADTWLMSPDHFDIMSVDVGQERMAMLDIGKRKNGTFGIRMGMIVA